MRNFLIKIGKAWNVLKKDGIFHGIKRIWRGFWAQFRIIKKGEILFVDGGVGDSARYRSENVAEELNFNGFMASVCYADNFFLLKYVNDFSIFIFHRVAYSSKIAKFIEEIKKQKKEIIFETDDLLYDGKLFCQTDYFQNINILEKKLFKNGLGREILEDDYVKVCTTTTTYLADKLRQKNKQVFVVPNRLSQNDLKITKKFQKSNKINSLIEKSQSKNVKMGYFSGTSSHNRDFATITTALSNILEKFPQVELLLFGPLEIENKLKKFSKRIKQSVYVDRINHFKNLAEVDINIVPLSLNDPFCEAKSELKFFEAGIVGVPTIAVKNQTFSEAIEDGVNGFLAGDEKEWEEKLEILILNKELRWLLGEKARQASWKKYSTINAKNEDYYGYLKNKIKTEKKNFLKVNK